MLGFLGGFLLLPVEGGIDFPLLPSFDKYSIPSLAVLAFVYILRPKSSDPASLPGLFPAGVLPKLLIAGVVIGSFLTVLTNQDSLSYGPRYIRGLQIYDAFSFVMQTGIILLPLLLARKLLGHPDQQRRFLIVICVAALGYSLLALYEVRMSPQLNRMIYGFFPHSWLQHIRGGGYRPLVFLSHGLVLAGFFMGTILAATALMRMHKGNQRSKYLLAALWLFMTLVLSNSLGALILSTLFTPVVFFLGTRGQLLVAAVVAVLVIFYPISRGAGILPINWLQTTATNFDASRGASMGTRLFNEERLLDHASKRPLFGWGGWGRNRVYEENGANTTITDGYWTIAITGGGWVRYLSEFMLLGLPVVLLFLRRRRYEIGPEGAAMALITAVWMTELVPNASLTTALWMAAGSLWGRLEYARVTESGPVEAETDLIDSDSPYTRMPHKYRRRGTKGLAPDMIPGSSYARSLRTNLSKSS
ncbi:O-antigen ligase family protein [Shimia sp.]|uniref:O-antigen ligase family protein n=1 Tax=Shimia sp. TaxID=1954381 RepID=UPI003297B359